MRRSARRSVRALPVRQGAVADDILPRCYSRSKLSDPKLKHSLPGTTCYLLTKNNLSPSLHHEPHGGLPASLPEFHQKHAGREVAYVDGFGRI
jgi:hypothetical protein